MPSSSVRSPEDVTLSGRADDSRHFKSQPSEATNDQAILFKREARKMGYSSLTVRVIPRNKNPYQIFFIMYAYIYTYICIHIRLRMSQLWTDHTGPDDVDINSRHLYHDRH